MRVLVTRAQDDAARTRDKLVAAGHAVVLSPVIEVAALEARWPGGVVDALLATSANAFMVMDNKFGPAPEARRLMPLILVGDRTARLAREKGFLGPAVVAVNATDLATRLGRLPHRPGTLVYLAGVDRKAEVELALEIADVTAIVVDVYHAPAAAALTAEAAGALRSKALDAVLHYSRRSAALFGDLASAHGLDLSRVRHVCLSDDVAAPLKERGLPLVDVAEAPNESALLARLDQA